MGEEKKCRVCKIPLTDDNWYPSYKENWNNICKDCELERQKKNFQARQRYITNRTRDWRRRTRIETIDSEGNRICFNNVNKRPYTNICEICGREMKQISYHHWNDEHPEFGLYLCSSCHMCVEKIEKIENVKEIYFNLKEKVEKGEI